MDPPATNDGQGTRVGAGLNQQRQHNNTSANGYRQAMSEAGEGKHWLAAGGLGMAAGAFLDHELEVRTLPLLLCCVLWIGGILMGSIGR